ncbi:hypothetical protein B4O97_03420 [Marispirochaeta aestuarii]|uniref:Uncharacterized protein n=1 Tax=Marispirochaeta aestuarii TaxID=1963862 RepID=A0A1Y1S174_9SPIO|nr:hypothetical protein [Marispirochaeta aestuarii]ORC37252.1 hypothetical protein B4O97_03420 [Marispirochaeta aestuarii]
MTTLLKLISLALILSACAQPMELETAPVAIDEPEIIPEPEPEPVVPIWQPADNMLYIFEADEMVREFETFDYDHYHLLLRNVKLTVTLHNREYGDTWRAVAGQCTWEA